MAAAETSLGRVIINADDFGCSSSVTRDITRCMQEERLSSTTIMANMPAFAEACAAARDGGFDDRIGVHLNLTAGAPLSNVPVEFRNASGDLAFPEIRYGGSPALLDAAAAELRAQIERVRSNGIEPTHFDSHNHIINGWPYLRVALALAREHGVRRMRLTRNAFHQASRLVTVLKEGFNVYVRFAGMRTTRWFTDIKPYVRHLAGGGRPLPGVVELMCHPGSVLDGVTDETRFLLEEPYDSIRRRMDLISYSEL
jgi:hypothetical protein